MATGSSMPNISLLLTLSVISSSSLLKCLLISPKSEFIIHIRYGEREFKNLRLLSDSESDVLVLSFQATLTAKSATSADTIWFMRTIYTVSCSFWDLLTAGSGQSAKYLRSFQVETDQGINCPFSNRIFQLAVDKVALLKVNSESQSTFYQKRSPESAQTRTSSQSTPSLFSSIFDLFVNDNKDYND